MTTYRFLLKTAYGLQNVLKIQETRKGDLIISQRSKFEELNLSRSEPLSTKPDIQSLKNTSVTVHPNLNSPYGTVTINYKSVNYQGEDRKVASALDVRHGLGLFPIFSNTGGNVAARNLTIDPAKYERDKFIQLWSGQEFDWSIQSLAYSVFVANPKLEFFIPQGIPTDILHLRFKYLQLIFMYRAIDFPTKGAGTRVTFEGPEGQALPGCEIQEALQFASNAIEEHSKYYPQLPDFHPDQLPEKLLLQSGVKIAPEKWVFKFFSFAVETHRDESLLRLKFHNNNGNVAIIDFNGEAITKFQDTLNHAIMVVPGLAAWKRPQGN